MSVPAQTSIVKKKGEVIDFKITGQTDVSGNAITDLTDYFFWLSVKQKPTDNDNEVLIRKETNDGFTVVDNNAYVSISSDESDALQHRVMFWDIWVEDTTVEKRWCIAQGTITLSDSVTKAKD